MDAKITPVDELSFRQAMDELQTIVKLLESNTLELEDSLAQYERGVALLKSLKNRLSQASFKVESLMDELEVNEDDKQRDTTLS
ncbi:Exodeoxyribonuclease 7 small subunit [Chlamydia trachomatis]|nr:Exodeoxyribonuclease 7 small subunit [Chlamydia trachomatis]